MITHQLRAEALALRIVTPEAGKRAAFEEDRRADSVTVMDAILLNIKNTWLPHKISLPLNKN